MSENSYFHTHSKTVHFLSPYKTVSTKMNKMKSKDMTIFFRKKFRLWGIKKTAEYRKVEKIS